jgi:hypothetical protein
MTTRIIVLSLALLALAASDASAVVGGKPADPADYPFLAAVGGGCGGALIAPDRVLTAAHCRDVLLGKRYVLVGPSQRRFAVRRLAIHPVNLSLSGRSEADPVPADFMLLELDRPVAGITPLELATAPPAPGTAALTIGRGTTDPDEPSDRKLRSGPVQIQADSSSACRKLLPTEAFRTWFTCVRDPRSLDRSAKGPFVSGCFGDSGSPLLVRDGLRWVSVGVDSWGPSCGTERDPEFYGDAVAARGFALAASPVWAPAPVSRPRVVGTARVGRVLTCSVSFIDKPRRVTYEFRVDGIIETFRKTPTYRVRDADRGKKAGCIVVAEGKGGTDASESASVRVAR